METVQIVFENSGTSMQHIFSCSIRFRHLPRRGEEVTIYDDDGGGLLDGIVEGVRWSITSSSYSVFICVRPHQIK